MDLMAGPDAIIDQFENGQTNGTIDMDIDESPTRPKEETLRADDFEAMRKRVMPPLDDLEVEEETIDTWKIEDWRHLSRREHGPTFQCNKAPWRVLFFPWGNNSQDCASFYLEHGFDPEPPADWYACVQFALVLWNPKNPTIFKMHNAHHRFGTKEADWGFTRFVELRKAFNTAWEGHTQPLVEDDTAMMTAYVRVVKDPTGVLWHNFEGYDSKKETNMVGLRNQGATCYLNSLLQSLYFTDAFRRAVYQIPTEQEQSRTNSAWALQRLFYKLQKDKLAVSTNELTASFGWDTRQIFEQQDVQELSRILMEKMEDRMKGTKAEKTLSELFVGKAKTYIKCINVDYESSRIEDFWDIQLNVRGNKNVEESFKDYTNVEMLDGDNKYDAGEHKLQDAKKGVIFTDFPPVLHLQLKRFEYDINRDAMMKVNDRHEFYEELDLEPYLDPESIGKEPWKYRLHGVLVHSGDFNAGHYYAFLKPTKDGHWYKFDDDRVTRSTLKEVLEENYGGEYAAVNGVVGAQRQPFIRGTSTKRSMNAYMLVYIRESRYDQVLPRMSDEDVPRHIETRILEEKAEYERRKKEKEEAHLYLNLGLISDRSFQHHHGFDLTTYDHETDDPALPQVKRVLRAKKVSEFAAEIAEELEVKADEVRFWVMVGRQNKTNRPDQPVSPDMTIEEAAHRYSRSKPFYIWAETATERDKDGDIVWPDTVAEGAKSTDNQAILVFLKEFDIDKQEISGVGHVYVRKDQPVSDIFKHISSIKQWNDQEKINLYEEIKFTMIETMKPKLTFHQSEIQDGDIICFEKQYPEEYLEDKVYRDAKEYYDWLLNKHSVKFYAKPNTTGPSFTLDLSKKMSFNQMAAAVGNELKIEPDHLRFATVHATTSKPKAWVKPAQQQTVSQILSPGVNSYGSYPQHRSDCLYYEMLETSFTEHEAKKTIKITWLPEGISKEEPLEVLVPKTGTVQNIVDEVVRKAKLDPANKERVRVVQTLAGKIDKELPKTHQISAIGEFVGLYAEYVPEEEANTQQEGSRIISCFHFDKEANKTHGVPFRFLLKPNEKFSDTRLRLSKRTGIKGKLLDLIKFAVVPKGNYNKQVKYLEPDMITMDEMKEDDSIGLDHVNKARSFWGKAEGMFIK